MEMEMEKLAGPMTSQRNTEGAGAQLLTELVQKCWQGRCIPDEWHFFNVAMIFKKGAPEDSNNYRPISLVNIAYKVYAMILLGRLKRGGAEQRLWPTQFGFRSSELTTDALFVVRRRFEAAWAHRSGSLLLVALDWSKAFDSLAPESLVRALDRFGVPPLVDAIKNIYSNRVFAVRDYGRTSRTLRQEYSIITGVPVIPIFDTPSL